MSLIAMLSIYYIILCGIVQINITVRSYPEASWLTSWSASTSTSGIFPPLHYLSCVQFCSFHIPLRNIICLRALSSRVVSQIVHSFCFLII